MLFMILNLNNFVFNCVYYLQTMGCAKGTIMCAILRDHLPFDEIHLVAGKELSKLRRGELSWPSQLQLSTDLLNCNVKTWVNADYTRLERPSLVKSIHLGVMTVGKYLPVRWVRMAPEVSEEKYSYALRFYHWFLKRL